ncbi:MAG TPA: TetR/AcrR family transcriptional regulator [Geobacteraceae bacterium]|nr:TetR/AcrR family transcriptional regulator [Geobacteraceae bacterium]
MNKLLISAKDDVQIPEVRKRLLTAALELFTRKGYAATSVREIVEVAGVTKPVLYYYFGNKEGIYLDLFRVPFRHFDDLLDSCRVETGISAADALTELCGRVFDLFVENLDPARLMYSIYYGPPQGAPFFDFDEYHMKLQGKVRNLVERGIQTGEFRAADAGDVMWIIIGVLNVAMEEQLCREKPDVDRARLARMLDTVLKGLAGNGTLR